MRQLLRRFGLAVSLGFVVGGVARADLISISIASTYVSGSVAGQSFADSTLTYTATLTTAQYDACRLDPTCYTAPFPGETGSSRNGFYHIASGAYLDGVTVDISGVGVFNVVDPVTVEAYDYSSNVFLQFVLPHGGFGVPGDQKYGSDGSYDLETPAVGSGEPFFFCLPSCSVRTSGGTLAFQPTELGFFTTFGTSAITVTPEGTTVTPEPATWVLGVTGLLGGVGAVRRRGRRRFRLEQNGQK